MQTPMNSGFGERTTAEEIARIHDLHGKTALITGGHSGIGLESTRVLARSGAKIIVGARDMDKAHTALADIPGAKAFPLDLSDPVSIQTFAGGALEACDKIDILMNNAGIMALPRLKNDERQFELQFSTNHLGHFHLTSLLWEALKRANGARVVTLSSYGHRYSPVIFDDPNFEARPYDKWKAYGQSKTANALFAVHLDELGQRYGIRSFAVHPGRIPSTSLKRSLTFKELLMMPLLLLSKVPVKTTGEGAATQVWAALSDQLDGKGGVYCADCDISPVVTSDSRLANTVRDYAVDPELAHKLWQLSEKMTGIEWPRS
ncbi:Oxidoreductase, short-chain dehydrogenase/reductase [Sphingobium indicum BiD32]|uniref:Oxidoreductase, short-chain dehydrogenase/reductase n=1 Tax=Sphingobium indicum BiD32 TaxID=1301087 RepID=N1MSE4_9SPHN|nr:SDR family NAD(P)-dependent oxidoreductase [Sphingobium indicum]CCW18328.1 Oxidoreductase, short-chain dehydrogenase/reductase [Sphingobium indicum BiD32]